MAATPEPTPRKFAFKPKEFDRVNEPRPGTGAEIPAPPAANDVFAIRQEIREREIAAGMDNLKPADRPQSTKRRRDYWLMLVAGNLAIAGTGAAVGFNVVTAVYTFSGVILFTVGLTWVMWVVVDRY